MSIDIPPGCPTDSWDLLTFEGCTQLRTVTIQIRASRIYGIRGVTTSHFSAIPVIVSRLPPTLDRIRLEIKMVDAQEEAALGSFGTIPWNAIDQALFSTGKSAIVDVYPMGAPEGLKQDVLQTFVQEGMSRTLAVGRLRIYCEHPFASAGFECLMITHSLPSCRVTLRRVVYLFNAHAWPNTLLMCGQVRQN